jgi:DNA-binding response OmpR family regulator
MTDMMHMADMTHITEGGKTVPPKALIADDDPAIVSLLADRLAKMGFSVDTATNGIQLLFKARRSHPDIIIVDVNMPELDGLEACLRLLETGSSAVDVIVITGGSDPVTAERCESLGLFYGRKGPEFWKSIEAALAEIFPNMIGKIAGLELQSKNTEVRRRPGVLLIDDDPAMHQFLASRLNKLGVDVFYASDAVRGFRIASKSRPSAIITDHFMPDGDAKYLLFRLRSNAATQNIPVIVISGRALDEVTRQGLRREICGRPGAAHIFEKSFDTHELFHALQSFFSFEKQTAKV